MDQNVRKRVNSHYLTKDMHEKEVKHKKYTPGLNVDLIINEKNNSSNESDIFQEKRNVYNDEESLSDPLQLHNDSHNALQARIKSDINTSESDIEESEKCNEQESVNPEEFKVVHKIKQWIIDGHHNSDNNNFNSNKEFNISVPVIDVSNVQCKSDFESFVLAQLVSLQSHMQRIENKLDNIANFLLDKKVCSPKDFIDFKTKYNLSFPINEKHLFILFDTRLKSDKLLQNDVCLELSKYVDKVNYSISKSYLSMIRAFMTKNVATQYTASRHSKENTKDIFKSTQFYECMEGVFLTAKSKTSLTTTNAELISNLSDVLSNAKKWNEKNK